MGSLYDQIKLNNGVSENEAASALFAPTTNDFSGLTGERARRFEAYKAGSNGKNYLVWEAEAVRYLERVNKLEADFQKAYAHDLADATSRIGKFRGALAAQGRPFAIKFNLLVWALILLAPFAITALYSAFAPAFSAPESGTTSRVIESSQVLLIALPLAILCAVIYPLSRGALITRKAIKALRCTGLSAENAANTISYHRSLYGFFFENGDTRALTNREFVDRVYRDALNLEGNNTVHFYDDQQDLPGTVCDFLKKAPQSLPTDFPMLDAPQPANYREFPSDSEIESFVQKYEQNRGSW